MGCCMSTPDDVDHIDSEWKMHTEGYFCEKWIIPEKVMLLRNSNDKLIVMKKHIDTLGAIHEMQMLAKSGSLTNPKLSQKFISYDFIFSFWTNIFFRVTNGWFCPVSKFFFHTVYYIIFFPF